MLYTNNLTIISLWFRTKMNKSKWKSWQILWYSLIIIIYGRRYCSFFGGVIWPNYRFNSVSVHFQILCSRKWNQLEPSSCFTPRVPSSLVSICQKWTYDLSAIRNRITVNLISLFTGLSAWVTANDHFDSFWTLFTQSSHHKNHKTLLKCWKS